MSAKILTARNAYGEFSNLDINAKKVLAESNDRLKVGDTCFLAHFVNERGHSWVLAGKVEFKQDAYNNRITTPCGTGKVVSISPGEDYWIEKD